MAIDYRVRARVNCVIDGAQVAAGAEVWVDEDTYQVVARFVDVVKTYGVAGAPVSAPANTIVLLGDSITENNTYTSSQHITNAQRGYFTFANALLGAKRMKLLRNAGVSGDETAQMLSRLEADVLAYRPAWCAVHAGINDLAGSLRGYRYVITNLNEIYTRLLRAGIKVIATTLLGVGTSHSNFSVQLHNRIAAVNQWIADKAMTTPGMHLVDFHGVFMNPTDANGASRSGHMWDTNAVHPACLGAYYLGKEFKRVMDPFLPAMNPLLCSIAEDWGSDVQTLTTLIGNGAVLTATLNSHKRKVGDMLTVVGANESGFNGQREIVTVPDLNTFTMAGSGSGTATGTITMSGAVNVLDEGLMQGSGGTPNTGVTGSVATGWTVERGAGSPTAACTVDARADGVGNDQTIVVTSGANGDIIDLRSADPYTRVNVGESGAGADRQSGAAVAVDFVA